jgi:predicted ATP-binding protein involved in virulence
LESSSRFKETFKWFYSLQAEETADHIDIGGGISSLKEKDSRSELKSLFDRNSGSVNRIRTRVAIADAIEAVVPQFSNPRIRANPLRLILTEGGEGDLSRELSLQMLSDGYRTMIAMVMDFARRLAQANPDMKNPLQAEAILLVDEIDLHLHPIWQQKVIPSLQRAFPNTQMVVSTHSPQVLSTVPSESILIVEPDGVRRCDAPTYGARSSDLVAEVLGLPSQRPPDNAISSKISELFRAIDAGDVVVAKAVRLELEDWAKGFPEPDLVRADVLIRRLDHQSKRSAVSL